MSSDITLYVPIPFPIKGFVKKASYAIRRLIPFTSKLIFSSPEKSPAITWGISKIRELIAGILITAKKAKKLMIPARKKFLGANLILVIFEAIAKIAEIRIPMKVKVEKVKIAAVIKIEQLK